MTMIPRNKRKFIYWIFIDETRTKQFIEEEFHWLNNRTEKETQIIFLSKTIEVLFLNIKFM